MAQRGDEEGVFDLEDWCFVSGGEEEDAEWDFVRGEGEQEGRREEDDSVDSDSLGDGKSNNSELGSSSLDENVLDMWEQFQHSAVDNKKRGMISSTFTPKRLREYPEIKVLVKDYVLPFLPAKSLTRFRSVSKEWDRWIGSPFLAHQQSYHFQQISGIFCQSALMDLTFVTLNPHAYGVPTPSLSFLPQQVNIKSSSNGLLLCQVINEYSTYYVCNPATNEWKQIPYPVYYHGSEPAIILGFEPSALNMDASYQLICAVPLLDHPIVCFEMYSSKTGYWRQSDTICAELGEDLIFSDNTFYMKGTAYWETSSREILAFNPRNEIHGIISLPPECPQGGILTEMREELCYIAMSNPNQNEIFIEIYGGMDLSLKHKIGVNFNLALPGYRILHCADDNVAIILNGGFLHSYSLVDQKHEVLRRVKSCPGTRYLPYVNSMVSVG